VTALVGCILATGKLSRAAEAELARRVKAGEREAEVRGELLLREHKAVGPVVVAADQLKVGERSTRA
jgi:hypothetical protein